MPDDVFFEINTGCNFNELKRTADYLENGPFSDEDRGASLLDCERCAVADAIDAIDEFLVLAFFNNL